MAIELQKIDVASYAQERNTIISLVRQIWTRQESADNAMHSIDRWGQSGKESGRYFYVVQEGKRIGITGYFIPSLERGEFGLRHHGTSVKGTGKLAMDCLISYLRETYGTSFKRLLEFIPEGREDLIPIFERWGFQLLDEPIPEWEPKRDYYKYYMVYEE